MFTLNCRGKILAAERPLVMGIFNATPDSFFEGHLAKPGQEILDMLHTMVEDGADIIDVGGQSTRPGSERISAQEEIERVVPVIELVKKHFPGTIISTDTYSSEVAIAAVHAGASIINDISGGNMDEAMLSTAAALQTPYICMHMQGTPDTMQVNPHYADVVKDVLDFFIARIAACKKAGIHDIIIDPGFGFGKTIEHNFSLLKNLKALQILDLPVLAGLSRKSTVYKTLQTTAGKALNGTTVLNTMALLNGASILRVHDVKEAQEAITLWEAYKKAP
ncbi:MAG: dihydropteroate synthase [Ferruginibacter sp.]